MINLLKARRYISGIYKLLLLFLLVQITKSDGVSVRPSDLDKISSSGDFIITYDESCTKILGPKENVILRYPESIFVRDALTSKDRSWVLLSLFEKYEGKEYAANFFGLLYIVKIGNKYYARTLNPRISGEALPSEYFVIDFEKDVSESRIIEMKVAFKNFGKSSTFSHHRVILDIENEIFKKLNKHEEGGR